MRLRCHFIVQDNLHKHQNVFESDSVTSSGYISAEIEGKYKIVSVSVINKNMAYFLRITASIVYQLE